VPEINLLYHKLALLSFLAAFLADQVVGCQEVGIFVSALLDSIQKPYRSSSTRPISLLPEETTISLRPNDIFAIY